MKFYIAVYEKWAVRKNVSLRPSARRHCATRRVGFTGCTVYMTAVTVVRQPEDRRKILNFQLEMFDNWGECARRQYP